MNEWSVALVGLAGALLGAVVGLMGLWWQHSAQRQHEVKQKCASLIFLGEQVRQELDKPMPFRKGVRVGEVDPFPKSPVEGLHNEMTAILRFLELAAKPKTYWLAYGYWNQTSALIPFHEDPERDEIVARLSTSRMLLVQHFRSRREFRRVSRAAQVDSVPEAVVL